MAITDRCEAYVVDVNEWGPGEAEDERASEHRQAALEALADGDSPHVALAHALLAIAERVSELSAYVARLG